MNEENENPSPWDSLIGELGVEVNPEALQRKQPAPKALPTVTHEQSEIAAPEATPSDWAGLASSLGLEVPPDEPPRKSETSARNQPETARTEKPREERADENRRREAKPREGRSRTDSGRGERQQGEKPRSDRQRGEGRADDRKSSRGRRREKPVEIQADIEFEEVLEVDDDEMIISESTADVESNEAAPQDPTKPRISGEAARSAFDALFSADAVNWGSAFVSPRSNVESSFLFSEGEEAVFAEDIPDRTEVDEDDEAEDGDKKRPRRRRRGGRGRGRGRKEDRAASDEGEEDSLAEGDEADEQLADTLESGADSLESGEGSEDDNDTKPEKRRRRRGRGRGRRGEERKADSDEVDDSHVRRRIASHVGDDDDDEEGDGDSGEEARAGHRNLPTWNDAIGVIVDGNLAQRSKAPPNQQNQSRGRGRGGRRHKKS